MSLSSLTWPEYYVRFGAVHTQTFSMRAPHDNPFNVADWTQLILPGGLYLDSDLLEALKLADKLTGNATCIVLDRQRSFPEQPPLSISLDATDWDAVRTTTVLGHVEVDVFPPLGGWGFVASPEGFGLLAGGDLFVERFLTAIPRGKAGLRERISEAIDLGEIGFGVEGKHYAEDLLRSIGWDRQ